MLTWDWNVCSLESYCIGIPPSSLNLNSEPHKITLQFYFQRGILYDKKNNQTSSRIFFNLTFTPYFNIKLCLILKSCHKLHPLRNII